MEPKVVAPVKLVRAGACAKHGAKPIAASTTNRKPDFMDMLTSRRAAKRQYIILASNYLFIPPAGLPSVRHGQHCAPVIGNEAIRVHEKVLLVLSSKSIRSAWVEKEVETAFEREAREKKPVLFPIRLDGVVCA